MPQSDLLLCLLSSCHCLSPDPQHPPLCSESLLSFSPILLQPPSIHLPHQLQNNLNIPWLSPSSVLLHIQKKGEMLRWVLKAVHHQTFTNTSSPQFPTSLIILQFTELLPTRNAFADSASVSPHAFLLQLRRAERLVCFLSHHLSELSSLVLFSQHHLLDKPASFVICLLICPSLRLTRDLQKDESPNHFGLAQYLTHCRCFIMLYV